MGSVHKQWTVVPSRRQHPSSVASPREHIAGGQVSVQPAALANRQFIVLLVLQHYLLSDYLIKLASMVSAWCLQVGADKAYKYCALVVRRATCRSLLSAHRLSALCVNAAAAHTAGVSVRYARVARVDSRRQTGVQMSAQNQTSLHARRLRSLPAGCSLYEARVRQR
jgi:hypothetical protein